MVEVILLAHGEGVQTRVCPGGDAVTGRCSASQAAERAGSASEVDAVAAPGGRGAFTQTLEFGVHLVSSFGFPPSLFCDHHGQAHFS